MYKFIFLLLLLSSFILHTNAQVTIKLSYPACELINQGALTDIKKVKTFVITSQEEFDTYFKITDNSKIDFSNNIVLVGLVGGENADKFIGIDAAQFIPQGRSLNIRYDVLESAKGTCGKYCVAVVHKMDYKHANFLKGRLYKISTQWGE